MLAVSFGFAVSCRRNGCPHRMLLDPLLITSLRTDTVSIGKDSTVGMVLSHKPFSRRSMYDDHTGCTGCLSRHLQMVACRGGSAPFMSRCRWVHERCSKLGHHISEDAQINSRVTAVEPYQPYSPCTVLFEYRRLRIPEIVS